MTDKNIIFQKINKKNINDTEIEIVERKGLGHPDTISDSLAEDISVEYSKYCIENFGCILRHMLDKISVTGGLTKVAFGGGEMLRPAKVNIKGRFTESVNGEKIPYIEIIEKVVYKHFSEIYKDFSKGNIVIENNIFFSPGPGIIFNKNGDTKNERNRFFIEQNLDTIKYHNNGLRSNDTSTSVCYFPLSDLENLVLETEKLLNDKKIQKKYPFIGTDIKIMGKREKKNISLTSCIPIISKYTKDILDYNKKLKLISELLKNKVFSKYKKYKINLDINTRDREANDDLYMTLFGSALESGDEGSVGRGNRVHGIIPFNRNFTMEAACGKNPVYHIGKVYTAYAYLISKYIYKKYKIENTIYITSQIGRQVSNPWILNIEVNKNINTETLDAITKYIAKLLDKPEKITKMILDKKIPFY
jgi:S-adenosylmethionine synthetase